MYGKAKCWAWATLVVVAMTFSSVGALADEDSGSTRIVVTGLADGGTQTVLSELRSVPDVDLRSHSWFIRQVESRAFDPDTILENPSDLEWIMDGGGIDLVIAFEELSDEDFQVRFLISDGGRTEREFLADRGSDGSIRRGGAMVIRHELLGFLETYSPAPAAAQPEEEPAMPQEAQTSPDDIRDDISDAEAFRRQAAREHQEMLERYDRDVLWLRFHGRFRMAEEAGFADSELSQFFGFRLDGEVFPFSTSDSDPAPFGGYLDYDHGFNSFSIVEENDNERIEYGVFVQDFSLEGGGIYRFDSPLNAVNLQIRLTAGLRYNKFRVSNVPAGLFDLGGGDPFEDGFEDANGGETDPVTGGEGETETTTLSASRTAVVLGARSLVPLTDGFALSVDFDVVPFAFLSDQEGSIDGASTFGFGANPGVQIQAIENLLHVSAGYSFQFYRTSFQHEADAPPTLSYLLNHGVRIGVALQY